MYTAKQAERIVQPFTRWIDGQTSMSVDADDTATLTVQCTTDGWNVYIYDYHEDEILTDAWTQTLGNALHVARCMLQGLPEEEWAR